VSKAKIIKQKDYNSKSITTIKQQNFPVSLRKTEEKDKLQRKMAPTSLQDSK